MRSREGSTFTERARRQQILTCAVELIAEQGYVNASVARVAERAQVAKSVVLYYFASKDELVAAIVAWVMSAAADVLAPAVLAENSAADKLRAYIRANCAFVDAHRTESVALFEIMTSFRTGDGLRLDQAAARSVATHQPQEGPLAVLDPLPIIEAGVRNKELVGVSAQFTKDAVRAALDGAVSQLARDASYDVIGYGEQLVTIFARATTPPSPPKPARKDTRRTS